MAVPLIHSLDLPPHNISSPSICLGRQLRQFLVLNSTILMPATSSCDLLSSSSCPHRQTNWQVYKSQVSRSISNHRRFNSHLRTPTGLQIFLLVSNFHNSISTSPPLRGCPHLPHFYFHSSRQNVFSGPRFESNDLHFLLPLLASPRNHSLTVTVSRPDRPTNLTAHP